MTFKKMSDYNFNSGYGQILCNQIAASVGPILGKIKVVIASGDEQFKIDMLRDCFIPDPHGKVRFFSDSTGSTSGLEQAYAACTSNADDIIVLAGNASHTLTAGIAWTKNRIHVIGMDGGYRLIDQGAKISSSATDATGYVLNVTGTRNTFTNVKLIQNSTNAAALNVLMTSGEGNVYKNCSFIFGVITNLNGTTAQEVSIAEDSGTFIDCEFGDDTLLTSAARQVMLIKQVITEMKDMRFRGCTWKISSSSATATMIRMNAITDILFTNLFEDCNFEASVDSAGGIALTSGAVQTGTGVVKGTLNFRYPATFNCALSVSASGYNAGVQVVAPTSVATAFKGIQPTA